MGVAKVAALASVILGCSVLLGWWWKLRWLRTIGPGWPPMLPDCALMILLLGFSLWMVLPTPRSIAQKTCRRIGQWLAFLTAMFGAWTLLDSLLGVSGGMSEGLLWFDSSEPASLRAFPSAVSALGLGLSLALLNVSFRGVWLAEVFAVLTGQIAVLALVGHAFGVSELYGEFKGAGGGGMAAHAGLGFLALSIGVLCARADRGIMAILRSHTPGGTMVRRWMFMPVVLLLALGLVHLLTGRRFVVDPALTSWFLFMTALVVLTVGVWATAGVLYRAGLERDHAQRTLEERVEERTSDLNIANQALSAAKEQLARANFDLEQTVEERTQHLKQTIRSLEIVCYNIAHDLRAPNRAIAGFAEVLLARHGARLDQTAQDCLTRIGAAARRSDALTLDLLAYGRLGHTELPCDCESLSLHVNRVISSLAADITATGASIEVSEPLPSVWANPTALEQVLSNLLTNAMKFVADGVTPRVCIRAEPAGIFTRVLVEDNGIGIPEEYQQGVFGVFERLDSSEKYPGSGIGLAIVQKSVERMGGRVGVTSKPQQGCCFWFELRTA